MSTAQPAAAADAVSATRYWQRSDAPGRQALLAALAALQPGQRLRLADALRARAEPADDAAAAPEGQRDAAPPPLTEYTTGAIRGRYVDPESREAELSFSSEAPYERWWGIEILGHGAGECDMSWAASGRAPFLNQHRADQQIGVIRTAWRDGKVNRARVRFGRTALADEVLREAEDDIRVNVSVGYEIRELELVKRDGDVSTYRVTDWFPLECSSVSIPADMTIGFGRSVDADPPPAAPIDQQRSQAAPKVPAQPRKERTMDQTTEKPPAGNDDQFRANVGRIQAMAAEYERWLKPTDVANAIRDGADPFKFQDLVMQRMQTGATDTTTLAGLGASTREQQQYSFARFLQARTMGKTDRSFETEVSEQIGKVVGRDAEGIFVPVDVMFRDLYGRKAGEQRDFNVGTASQAGNLVQTSVDAALWTDVFRPAMALSRAGVMVLPGLTGNIGIPRKTAPGSVGMLTEIAAAAETQPTTALPTLSPKRVGGWTQPSKQSIIQSAVAIEPMLRQDLVDTAAVLIENQGLNGDGASPNARGIRNVSGIGSVAGGANGATLAWSHIVGIEGAVGAANGIGTDRAGYITNTAVMTKAKTVQKATNLDFIWDRTDRPLNGYAAHITNNVPSNLVKGTSGAVCSSAIYSSDWSMFVLGLFGGLDITVDPYSSAKTGQVDIVLNMYFDWVCRQPAAFATIDDLLTA